VLAQSLAKHQAYAEMHAVLDVLLAASPDAPDDFRVDINDLRRKSPAP
jgi:hypothetical protein